MKLTLAFTYCDDEGALKKQTKCWDTYDTSILNNIAIIMVDDCSQKISASDVLGTIGESLPRCPFHLYRINDNIMWNLEGARNLAFKEADDGWIFYTDIDHIIPNDSLINLLKCDLNPNSYYVPNRYLHMDEKNKKVDPHEDTFIITKKMFWKTGGYDEDFAGYYGGYRRVFLKTLKKIARRERLYDVYVLFIGGEAESRMVNNIRKGSKYYFRNNSELRRKSMKLAGKYKPKNPLRFNWEQVL